MRLRLSQLHRRFLAPPGLRAAGPSPAAALFPAPEGPGGLAPLPLGQPAVRHAVRPNPRRSIRSAEETTPSPSTLSSSLGVSDRGENTVGPWLAWYAIDTRVATSGVRLLAR